jgi:hypothetical protein
VPTVAGEVSLVLLRLAILTVTYSILIIAYHMIQRREHYHELGGDTFDKHRPEVTARRLIETSRAVGIPSRRAPSSPYSHLTLFSDQEIWD